MNNNIKYCTTCNNTFSPRNSKHICCSKECAKINQRNKNKIYRDSKSTLLDKECISCKKGFSTRNNGKKFCCERCSINYHNKKHRPIYDGIKCKNCDITFVPKKSIMVYCTRECNEKYNQKLRIKYIHIENNCDTCNKLFITKTKAHKYCSTECRLEQYRLDHVVKILPSRNCKNCGITFKPTRGVQKHCTNTCTRMYSRYNVTKEEDTNNCNSTSEYSVRGDIYYPGYNKL